MKNVTSYRVIYGDTDQMGVAYYANYLRWFEIGRTEFMREAGVPYQTMERDGFFFPVTEVACRYRRPARYDNLLRIETTVESLGRVALRFNYRIALEMNRVPAAVDSITLASGWTKHACVGRDHKLTRLPAPFARALGLAAAGRGGQGEVATGPAPAGRSSGPQ